MNYDGAPEESEHHFYQNISLNFLFKDEEFSVMYSH